MSILSSRCGAVRAQTVVRPSNGAAAVEGQGSKDSIFACGENPPLLSPGLNPARGIVHSQPTNAVQQASLVQTARGGTLDWWFLWSSLNGQCRMPAKNIFCGGNLFETAKK